MTIVHHHWHNHDHNHPSQKYCYYIHCHYIDTVHKHHPSITEILLLYTLPLHRYSTQPSSIHHRNTAIIYTAITQIQYTTIIHPSQKYCYYIHCHYIDTVHNHHPSITEILLLYTLPLHRYSTQPSSIHHRNTAIIYTAITQIQYTTIIHPSQKYCYYIHCHYIDTVHNHHPSITEILLLYTLPLHRYSTQPSSIHHRNTAIIYTAITQIQYTTIIHPSQKYCYYIHCHYIDTVHNHHPSITEILLLYTLPLHRYSTQPSSIHHRNTAIIYTAITQIQYTTIIHPSQKYCYYIHCHYIDTVHNHHPSITEILLLYTLPLHRYSTQPSSIHHRNTAIIYTAITQIQYTTIIHPSQKYCYYIHCHYIDTVHNHHPSITEILLLYTLPLHRYSTQPSSIHHRNTAIIYTAITQILLLYTLPLHSIIHPSQKYCYYIHCHYIDTVHNHHPSITEILLLYTLPLHRYSTQPSSIHHRNTAIIYTAITQIQYTTIIHPSQKYCYYIHCHYIDTVHNHHPSITEILLLYTLPLHRYSTQPSSIHHRNTAIIYTAITQIQYTSIIHPSQKYCYYIHCHYIDTVHNHHPSITEILLLYTLPLHRYSTQPSSIHHRNTAIIYTAITQIQYTTIIHPSQKYCYYIHCHYIDTVHNHHPSITEILLLYTLPLPSQKYCYYIHCHYMIQYTTIIHPSQKYCYYIHYHYIDTVHKDYVSG